MELTNQDEGHAARIWHVEHAVDTQLILKFGLDPDAYATATTPGPLILVRICFVDAGAHSYFHYLTSGLGGLHREHRTLREPLAAAAQPHADFELTLKLVAEATEGRAAQAPLWPCELLARVGVLARSQPHKFQHDFWLEHISMFGPQQLRHVACATDQTVPHLVTKFGAIRYLQLYAISETEVQLMRAATRANTTLTIFATRCAQDANLKFKRRAILARVALVKGPA